MRQFVLLKKWNLHKIFSFFEITILLFLLSGCFNDDPQLYTQYETSYDTINDQTYILWQGPIENNTIYNIISVTLQFGLYNNGVFIKNTEEQTIDILIRYGETKIPNLSGYSAGEIDEIELIYWIANYDSFYSTYFWWIICSIISLVLLF